MREGLSEKRPAQRTIRRENSATLSRRNVLAGCAASRLFARLASASDEPEFIPANRMGAALLQLRQPQGLVIPPGRPAALVQTSHKFLFGCNLFRFEEMDSAELETAYRQRFADLFNYATIPVYWRMAEPKRGRLNLQRQDRMVAWCRANGIAVKGHPLAYNNNEPDWLPDDPREIEKLLADRIRSLEGHYQEQVEYWDVVNEAVGCLTAPGKRNSAPRMTAMIEKMGIRGYLQECFRVARQAEPRARLVINEVRLGDAFAEEVLSRMAPEAYDIIGMQAHQHGGAWASDRIEKPCARFRRFGKPLHFTEVTIISGKQQNERSTEGERWETTPEGEERQARDVEHFYTLAFRQPQVNAVTWWDLSDFMAWKGAPAGLLRRDMSPKPAYGVLKRLIRGKWMTRLKTETGIAGSVHFRGFLGGYRVTVGDGERLYQGSFFLDATSDQPIGVDLSEVRTA